MTTHDQAKELHDNVTRLRDELLAADAQIEVVARLKAALDKRHAQLLDSTDPEDGKAIRELSDCIAQMQLIPTRQKKALDARNAAACALLPAVEQFQRSLAALGAEETAALKSKYADLIRPIAPVVTDSLNGAKRDTAAVCIGTLYVWHHIAERTAPPRPAELSASRLTVRADDDAAYARQKADSLRGLIEYSAVLLFRFDEYTKAKGSFIAPSFSKGV